MAAAADHDNDPKLHLVMFPWLASGHLIPFLELSKALAKKGHTISYITTPRNLTRLPPNLSHLINLIGFPLPAVNHLPSDVDLTIDLPSNYLRPYLRIAYDALEPQLSAFLDSSSPDWLILDYAPYWAARVARARGVRCAFFSLFSASCLTFYGTPSALVGGEGARTTPEELTVSPDWIPFPSPVVYRPHEARKIFNPDEARDNSGVSEAYRFSVVIADCDIVAVRSCGELERDYLKLLETYMYHKPVIPLGLLPPVVPDRTDSTWDDIFEWLERQKSGSVVYAAFGSEAKLSVEQVRRIAVGLESSELPFIWAFRRPQSVPDRVDVLPEGFADMVGARGIVCEGWAPQVNVLAHPSVGGFLTHVGWNSIVEGLQHGRVLALLPLMYDQGLNARFISERRAGVEVPRNEEDGSFTSEDIAATLRMVMVEEEGEEFRAAAKEMGRVPPLEFDEADNSHANGGEDEANADTLEVGDAGGVAIELPHDGDEEFVEGGLRRT
ncbi:putative UDP-rhamnose:rhamnosyltransferase 1 [Acorus calamus]|uniref:UDP-rhamnose:rhamnosyltransferase 1 n=1 Tax=Acorus calamus TaxID=4465 RepID=A0AAV9DGW1_ACOCL|nr:putative UDP-rhamnose:rhamnosyltransferase 1 [Acorus calamus]